MKSKLKNPTCIAIVVTAMILAIIFSSIAIFILPGLKDEATDKKQAFKLESLFDRGNGIFGDGLGGGLGGDIGGGGGLDLSGNIGMSPGGSGGAGEGSVAYEVYVSEEQNVYLKIKSFGDYTGRSWSEATAYTEYFSLHQEGSQYSGNYLTGLLMSEQNSPSMYIAIKPHTGQYAIPYYTGVSSVDNYDVQLDDVVTKGTPPEEYNMYFYSGDPTAIKTYGTLKQDKLQNARDFEREYRRFVKDNYLYVDDETRAFMIQKIEELGIRGEVDEIIKQVSDYISSAAVYDLEYDRSLDAEENIAIAFLDKYKTGICQHYATAATLLFRTLGIPARYTIGYAGTAEKQEWIALTSNDAHAWVEVYIEGVGWMYVEVTGSSVIQPPQPPEQNDYLYEVTLKPSNVAKRYDGTPLTPSGMLDGFEEFEAMGYSYVAEIAGSQTSFGKSSSSIRALTIYDPEGNIVTDKFKCKYKQGTLHVYRGTVAFVSDSSEITYDGMEHTNDALWCYLLGGELAEGHTYMVTPTARYTNVGYVSNSFDIEIIDLNSGYMVTDQYRIVKNFGRLNVLPKSITFKAGDAQKAYDGIPLTCDIIEIIDGSLAPNHQIFSYEITGSQTEIGRSENMIDIGSIIIVDEKGTNVTENYAIHTEKGKLRVTYK